jgi:hypothetical protein
MMEGSAMSVEHVFEPITEVTADDRARISFGRIGVHRNDRFLVSRRPTGELLLTPMASIPQRELLVWENEQVRHSLQRGLTDVGAGRVSRRDDYLDGDNDDDE